MSELVEGQGGQDAGVQRRIALKGGMQHWCANQQQRADTWFIEITLEALQEQQGKAFGLVDDKQIAAAQREGNVASSFIGTASSGG